MTLRAAFVTALPTPTLPPRAPPEPSPGRFRTSILLAVFLAAGLLPVCPCAPADPSGRYDRAMRFHFADFEVDEEGFALRRSGEPVAIAPLPLKLLVHLLRRYPAAPSRDEIMDELWPDAIVSEASLSQAVRAARIALGEGARTDGVLRTVRGRGFKIGVPVRTDSDSAVSAELPEPRDPLVGREREMERGRAALARALGGQPSFFVLIGDPGIGKTRLAEELAAEASTAGALVLFGRASEGGHQPAFWPWLQILRGYASATDPATLAGLLGRGAADVATVAPDIAERLSLASRASTLEPEQARFAFFDAMDRFLVRASRQQPLVLVLDDLHWADEGSLLLLEFLSRELGGARLLLVATSRSAELAEAPELQRALAALARAAQGFDSLTLTGLEREDMAWLIEAWAGEPPSPALLEAVCDRSEGNPLFARELVRWLAAGGPAGREAMEEIPVGVQQLIRQRLRELPEEGRRALATAALIGREFPVLLLSRACEQEPEALLAAIEPAERAGILDAVPGGAGRLRFAHALVQEVLEADLSSRERAGLHLRVGEALAALNAAHAERVLPELAAHFAAALPLGDPKRPFDYALRAAEMDLRLLAFEQAVRNARLALRIADETGALPPAARNRVLLLLADAQFHAGRREDAARTWWALVDSARRSRDAAALADAAMSLALANVFTAHSHQETVGLLREALDGLGGGDSPRRARLLSWLARQVTWTDESDRQDELTCEAVEMARRLGRDASQDPDPRGDETLLDVLGARGSVLEHGGADEDRQATYDELLTRARQSGSRVFEADALTLRLQHRIELVDAGGIDRDLALLERLGEDLRHPFYRAFAARAKAMRALWRGDPDAESLVQQATAAGQEVDREHAAVVLAAQLTALRRLQGRVGELEAGAREAADRYPMMASFRCGLAAIQLEAGDPVAARETFERLAEGDFAEIRPDRPNYALNLALLAEVCVQLGDADRARPLRAKLAPLAGRYLTAPNAVTAGCASRPLGALAALLGESEEAERFFAEALEVERRMGARTWTVATLCERGRARAKTRPGDAREDLDEAVRLASAGSLAGPLAAAEALRGALPAPRRRRKKSS